MARGDDHDDHGIGAPDDDNSDDQGAGGHDDDQDERDGLADKLSKLFNFSFSCAGDRSTVSCMPRLVIVIRMMALPT